MGCPGQVTGSGTNRVNTGPVPFYRRRWEETRGDQHDDWGRATYYFWMQGGVVEQQIERYDSGVVLAYDRYHIEDEFGGLSRVELNRDEWAPFEIDIGSYQRETDVQPYNRTH